MKFIFFALCLLSVNILSAQDQTVKSLQADAAKTITKDPNDTVPKLWHTGSIFSLNLAQGSLSNWAAGGDDFSMALNAYIGGHAYYKKGKNSWDNTLDINIGYSKTTSTGARKNDDRVDLLSKYGYELNPKLNLTTLFNFRSQFFKGYSYPDNNTKVLSSNILAPAYVLLSVGLDYHPVPELSIFVSPVTSRVLIVNDDSLSAAGAYGVTPGKKAKSEIGAFATISYTKPLNKIITYKGRLDLFSNYGHNPQNIDINMNNIFIAKLSKVLSATWSIDIIYDDDVRLFGKTHTSPALQLKSLIGVGLLVKL